MIVAHIHHSLRDVDRAAWNACFAGVSEDYDYLLATEEAGIADFNWLYMTAWQGNRMIAAMPGFLTRYALDTTMDGKGRRIVDTLKTRFPGLLKMQMACLGSPVTKYGTLGLHQAIKPSDQALALRAMMTIFEQHAAANNCTLFALKDVPDHQYEVWTEALRPLGYRSVPSLPMAVLDTPFDSIENYFAFLSYSTRKNMRRKLRSLNDVRIERRENIDDVLPAVMDLYRQTQERADLRFEKLTPAFFQNVLRTMPGRAFVMLYYVEDRLLGANLLIHDGDTLVDKYFCMDAAGRDHNLYFLSWFTNVGYCLDHRLASYHSGQSAYENKVRLGSRLIRTSIFFRHRNRLIHGALKLAAPLLSSEDMLEEAA